MVLKLSMKDNSSTYSFITQFWNIHALIVQIMKEYLKKKAGAEIQKTAPS